MGESLLSYHTILQSSVKLSKLRKKKSPDLGIELLTALLPSCCRTMSPPYYYYTLTVLFLNAESNPIYTKCFCKPCSVVRID